ncbi:hypothetical protein SLH46_17235 [Draconibacterium sp. IB214405]|uniref:hypothetical protein n=1 Tax=Draconibacterium sp. IB214405 TaxID=3097352 RepID=UPI002A0F8EDD|nr:hypothetical protein [Draconibacterium sp. IB214405]MDX8340946.1 hypothetical protein [Draconibacterium sp. IB214405]
MKTTRTLFAVNLLRNVKILALILGIVFTVSCEKDEPPLDQSLLQGTWGEIEPENLGQFAGSNHTFTFKEDSFFLELFSWTDVLYIDEDGNPVEPESYGYIKGIYSFDLDNIYFDGVRCLDSTYAERPDGDEVPGYIMSYSYEIKSSIRIILAPESDYESITLVKE